MSSVGVPPITFDLRDLTTEQGLIKFNDHINKVVTAINTLYGLHGPVPIQNSINMGGNTIQNLGAPVNPTDAIHQQAATQQFGPAVIQAQMEVTGNNMLQTVRMLNNQVQREQYSSFLNQVTSTPPGTNSSTATVVNNGATTTVTFSAGIYTLADGESIPYAARSDTFNNPVAQQTYYYYFDKNAAALNFTGPFTQNTAQNAMSASTDGRGFIGVFTLANGGGGTAGGGANFGAGRGCLEVGTLLKVPDGKKSNMIVDPCNDWIVIHFEDGRKIVAARDTRIAVFKKVQDLDEGDLTVQEDGNYLRVESTEESHHESYKMKMMVQGRVYYGNGILFANWKPIFG